MHNELRPKLLSTVFFHNPTFPDTCKQTKNKSWRRCRLYFRGRMQCWWIFDFETNYTLTLQMYCGYCGNRKKKCYPLKPVGQKFKKKLISTLTLQMYCGLHFQFRRAHYPS
jgi:hypothetical protein